MLAMKVIALEKKIRPFMNPSWPISSTNQVPIPCWKGHLGAWMMWHLVPIAKSKSMEHNTYVWGRKNKLYMEIGPRLPKKKKNVYHPCCVGFLSPGTRWRHQVRVPTEVIKPKYQRRTWLLGLQTRCRARVPTEVSLGR
jgi:hypothetical protein